MSRSAHVWVWRTDAWPTRTTVRAAASHGLALRACGLAGETCLPGRLGLPNVAGGPIDFLAECFLNFPFAKLLPTFLK